MGQQVRGPFVFGTMPMLARFTGLMLALLLPACGGDEATPSSEENRQLDAAENMLDEAPRELDSVESPPGNQEQAGTAGSNGG